jgi:hypothetical protein
VGRIVRGSLESDVADVLSQIRHGDLRDYKIDEYLEPRALA